VEQTMQDGTRNPTLDHLDALVGEWSIDATHQAMPGEAIRGRATFEWLPGRRILIWRTAYEHPQIPDSISVLGCYEDETCTMHYFDERGVRRVFTFAAEPGRWRYWNDTPGFSQRFAGTFSGDGNTLEGVVELSRDGSTWEADLPIRYSRTA
jgi:hypothetical protein